MSGERLDWLPVGWKVRTRVRCSGKKDKYYVNPSKGLKFKSKLEVLRYLKISGEDRKPKELVKIGIKGTASQELPPGWIKEIRTRKKGIKKRRDPYYIDPVSGSHFRSMQEVFRYLESKDSEDAKSKPQDNGHDSSCVEAKGHGSIDKKKAKKIVTGNRSVKSGSTLASGLKGASRKNVKMSVDNHLEQSEEGDSLTTVLSDKLQLSNRVKQRANRAIQIKKYADNRLDKDSVNKDKRSKSATRLKKLSMPYLEQKDKEERNLSNKLPQVNAKEQINGGRRRSMRLAICKQKDHVIEHQSLKSEGAAEKFRIMPESNDSEQRGKQHNNSAIDGRQHENSRQKKRKPANNTKCTAIDLPRRTSKRLAREDPNHPLTEIKTSNKPTTENSTETDLGKAGPSKEPQIDSIVKPNNDSSEVLEHNFSISRKECKEKPIISHDLEEDEKHGKSIDSSLEGLLMDPCIDFAVKTLTGAIPVETVNKSPSAPSSSNLAPGHVWSDPCFEFAVKMLTGEMPVEDGSRFHITPQQPPSNCSFSQLDAVKKPCVGVKDP